MVKQRVSYISRGATVAWGPTSETAGLVAAGTVAGAISDSFDASSTLEIFSLDLGSQSGEMPVLGSLQLPERFHCLAWGAASDATGLPYGMLAGGMVDGTVKVFDPSAMTGCARRRMRIAPRRCTCCMRCCPRARLNYWQCLPLRRFANARA